MTYGPTLLSPDRRSTLLAMRLADRVRRWWKPAKWRDEHPEETDTEGEDYGEGKRRLGSRDVPGEFDRYGEERAKGM
jgi:hypothetical protein